jgi:nucleotide-binding universal stress UspA family protein
MPEYTAGLNSFRRVLCATDLTARSEAAVHRAIALARQTGARLTVVHATEDRPPGRVMRLQINRAYVQLLAQLDKSFRSDVKFVDVVVRAGSARRVIIDTANEVDADLVVMAPPRPRRFDWIVGTTAERFIRATNRPLLVVHQPVQNSYRNVTLASDLSNASVPMLRTAVRLGVLDHAQATILHALQTPYEHMLRAAGVNEDSIERYHLSYQQETAQRLESMLVAAGLEAERTRVSVRTDPPALAIREVIEREQPELLAIGASRWFLLKRVFIGSVADELLRAPMCDMLVIPHRSDWTKLTPRGQRRDPAPTDRWTSTAA